LTKWIKDFERSDAEKYIENIRAFIRNLEIQNTHNSAFKSGFTNKQFLGAKQETRFHHSDFFNFKIQNHSKLWYFQDEMSFTCVQ